MIFLDNFDCLHICRLFLITCIKCEKTLFHKAPYCMVTDILRFKFYKIILLHLYAAKQSRYKILLGTENLGGCELISPRIFVVVVDDDVRS